MGDTQWRTESDDFHTGLLCHSKTKFTAVLVLFTHAVVVSIVGSVSVYDRQL